MTTPPQNPRTLWTDDRLTYTLEGFEHRLRGVEALRDKLLVVEAQSRECNAGIQSLTAHNEKRDTERKREQEVLEQRRYELEQQRLGDRWKLAALLVTCMGIIVSAVALFTG